MEGQAGILQHRVEPVAVRRRRTHAQERVRGQQDEQQEADADHALHREHARAQLGRQVVAEQRHRAPHSDSMNTQRTIEPSWFPHTPVIW